MKRVISILIMSVFFVSSLGGCVTTSPTGEKTAAGASLGGILGGVIGYATTGKASGALAGAAIGAAVGGLAGYAIGNHEEEKYKSAKQVYKENPEFAKKSSTLPLTVVNLQPYVSDQKGSSISTVETEQPIKLCMAYDIAVGSANNQKTVNKEDIVLDNYLVMPDGTETPHSERHPAKDPTMDGYKDCITIEKGLPKGIPNGNYAHFASVKIGGQEMKKMQNFLVAKSDGKLRVYASVQPQSE